jgi:hypothetical protein
MIALNVRFKSGLIEHQQVALLRRAALCRKSTPSPACSCMLVSLACANPFLHPRSEINSSKAARQFSLPQRHIRTTCAPGPRCSSTTFDQRRASTPCPICSNSTQVPCDACKGSGRLTKSGYHAKNPVNAAKIVGNRRPLCKKCMMLYPCTYMSLPVHCRTSYNHFHLCSHNLQAQNGQHCRKQLAGAISEQHKR